MLDKTKYFQRLFHVSLNCIELPCNFRRNVNFLWQTEVSVSQQLKRKRYVVCVRSIIFSKKIYYILTILHRFQFVQYEYCFINKTNMANRTFWIRQAISKIILCNQWRKVNWQIALQLTYRSEDKLVSNIFSQIYYCSNYY